MGFWLDLIGGVVITILSLIGLVFAFVLGFALLVLLFAISIIFWTLVSAAFLYVLHLAGILEFSWMHAWIGGFGLAVLKSIFSKTVINTN